METTEESVLKETLSKNRANIKFASVFGSFRRGHHDPLSDIDVLIVCDDDRLATASSLARLDFRIDRKVHVITFTSIDFGERMGNHDYLVASLLDDSEFIFGDEQAFLEGKRTIFTGLPDTESVEFNERMGLMMLKRGNDRVRSLLSNVSFIHNLETGNTTYDALLGCLKDYHLGLGYLAASAKMRQLNKAISLRQLLTSDDYPFVKDLILTEKSIMRKGTVNPQDATNLFNYTKRLLNTLGTASGKKIL